MDDYRVLVIGGVGVGKTSIIERLLRLNENLIKELPKGLGGVTKEPTKYALNSEVDIWDFPGLRQISRPGEYTLEALEAEIQVKFNEKAAILLAVIAADDDVVNADVLKLIRKLDCSGQRSIIAVTKTDLIADYLDTKVIEEACGPCRGVVYLRNRGFSEPQLDVDRAEHELLLGRNIKYRGIADLRSLLNRFESEQKWKHYSTIQARLRHQLSSLKKKQSRLADPNSALIALSKFIDELTAIFEGSSEGASKIGFIFGFQWPRTLQRLRAAEGCDLRGLEIALKNSKVSRNISKNSVIFRD